MPGGLNLLLLNNFLLSRCKVQVFREGRRGAIRNVLGPARV